MVPLRSVFAMDAARTQNSYDQLTHGGTHQPQDMQEAVKVRAFAILCCLWFMQVVLANQRRLLIHVLVYRLTQQIGLLRSELRWHRGIQFDLADKDKPCDDAEVFRAIKERVVEEFELPKEYIDVLYSAEARFPGDQDVINSAGYLKHNRSKQGQFQEGDAIPMHEMPLASLDGTIATLAERLVEDPQGLDIFGSSQPVVLVAGSIT